MPIENTQHDPAMPDELDNALTAAADAFIDALAGTNYRLSCPDAYLLVAASIHKDDSPHIGGHSISGGAVTEDNIARRHPELAATSAEAAASAAAIELTLDAARDLVGTEAGPEVASLIPRIAGAIPVDGNDDPTFGGKRPFIQPEGKA